MKISNINNKNYSFNIIIWLIFIIFSLFFLLNNKINKNFNDSLSIAIQEKFYVIQFFLKGTFSSIFFNNIDEKFIELQQENKELKKQVFILAKKELEIELLKKDYQELSNLLNIKNNPNILNFITVAVLHDSNTISNILVASIDKNPDITENTLIISNKGVVGYIRNITDTKAYIVTTHSKNFRISGISEDSKANLIIIGNGTDSPNIEIYSQNINLHENETILTSGLEGRFPKNIPIGKIIKNKKNEISLQFFESLHNLNYIHIVK